MARTFQKEIACCEKAYSDNPESYTPRQREILAKVIAFLEGGNSIKRPAYARYICKNFRLSGKALAKKWNTSYPEDKKDEATFRTQVSVVSKELRKIFSYSPTEVFLNETEDTKASIDKFFRYRQKKLGYSITNIHAIRKSFNSNDLRYTGLQEQDIAYILGHSIRTNREAYTFIHEERLDEVRNALNTVEHRNRGGENETS